MSAEIFKLDDIDLHVEPHEWAYARGADDLIRAHWKARLDRTPALFDGRVLLMHRHGVENGVLRGACFEAAFSHFLAWRDFGFPDPGVHNVFGMAALRGSDGAYLVGEMGRQTASAGQVYFPAGTPDPDDVSDGRLDLAASVLRELEEETGVGFADVDVAPGWTVVQLGARIACMREISLRHPAVEAARAIEATLASQTEPELSAMHVISSLEDARAHDMPDFMQAFFRHALAD